MIGAQNDLTVAIKTIADTMGITKTDEAIAKLDATQKLNAETGTNWNKVMGVAAVAVGAALVTGAVVSIKAAGDFQASMVKLTTSAGESVANLGTVSSGVMKIARDTGTTTNALADAMYKVESGGQHGADGLLVLKAAAQGAKAEQSDLTVVADAVTSVLVDYHLKAKDAADVTSKLVAATAAGKMSFQDLAGAMPAILPVASAAHVSLNDILGDMASMTVHGMSAQQSAENLTDTIRHMQAPTAMQGKELALLGMTTTQLADDMKNKGLSGTLQEISTRIANLMPPGSDKVILNLKTALSGLSEPVKELGQHLFDGTMSMKDYTKAAGALDPISAKQAISFATLAGSMHRIGDAQMSGSDVMQNYGQALARATGDATGLKVALMLTGENADITNAAIKSISGSAADAAGNVKGWDEVQGTFNNKLQRFEAVIQTSTIAIGTKLLPIAGQAMDSFTQFGEKIGNFVNNQGQPLIKAFESMGDAIGNKLMPAIGKLLTSDFVKIVGVAFVAAIIGAVDVLNVLTRGIAYFINQIAPVTSLLVGVTAGIVAYKVAMEGMVLANKLSAMYMASSATGMYAYNGVLVLTKNATVAQTVAQTALNTALKLNPFALAAAAAVGIVTAYIAAYNQNNATTGSVDRLKAANDRLADAQNKLKESSDKLKEANKSLTDANYNQEGAVLRVKEAQKNYNDVVAQYGPNSLEAQQAAHDLTGANRDLAAANDAVAQKTREASKAQQDSAKAAGNVKVAEDDKKKAVDITTGSIQNQKFHLDDLTIKLGGLNNKSFNYSVNQTTTTSGGSAPAHKAGGGSVSANTPYIVGDNPDGSINSTSELFVPSTSGTIVKSKDLQKALGGNGGGGNTYHFSGNIILGDSGAVNSFFNKLDQDGLLVGKGLTPNRGMS